MKTTAAGVCLLTVALAGCLGAAETAAPAPVPVAASGQTDQRIQWWRDARFGMFIHWGLYAVPAGEWGGKQDWGEWFLESTKMPVSQYEKYETMLNPVKFDAREWVRRAKAAGMKYIVITTKHHDGFGMFRSDLTDWCIKSTPFSRDPVKELADACHAEGIHLGLYYSIMDWHHPDWPQRRAWNDRATGAPDMERYVTFMKGQIKELLTRYGPIDVMWFDGAWEDCWTPARGTNLETYVRSLQPNILINNRVSRGDAAGDFRTPEQTIPPTGLPGVDWESCMTMNEHWGYNKADQQWKDATTLIRNLIDCAGKGGNYLLNVGPTAEGVFPPTSIERLQEIGKWMNTNGEAIYGTTASPFRRLPFNGRCTQKRIGASTRLYLLVYELPANRQILVPVSGMVTRATILSKPGAMLPTTVTEDGVIVDLRSVTPDAHATVVALDMAGSTCEIAPK